MTDYSSMNGNEAAQAVATEAVEGQPAGSQAVAQTEGQVDNPHTSSSGENHVDGWSATVESEWVNQYRQRTFCLTIKNRNSLHSLKELEAILHGVIFFVQIGGPLWTTFELFI